MAPFKMCKFCQSEYDDPLNRRFHAQPVACPECGPHLWIDRLNQKQETKGLPSKPDPIHSYREIEKVQDALLSGKIVGIKGLGGFHLACDATNHEAVLELRRRKLRVDKPFALMMSSLEVVKEHCNLNENEIDILLSKERPIVLLERNATSMISPAVAPNQATLGVMLPYTPLHHLLFENMIPNQGSSSNTTNVNRVPLVMTSGNISEEPIAFTNEEALERLADLADLFLMSNRDIHIRCDDSVVRCTVETSGTETRTSKQQDKPYFVRRARGYAPNPIKLPFSAKQVIATGPELKNTFCLTKEKYAFISHHIGDMENYETLSSFEQGISHFENVFRLQPEAIACDLHPDYLTTRYAKTRSQREDLPLYQIQHHHAHIAACMVENGLSNDKPVIGVAFDGTGYGVDGTVWGGEFLITNYCGFHRFAHLEYSKLPGGDAATRKPYRIALAQLWQKGIHWDEDLPPVMAACGDDMTSLKSMLEHEINTPKTSSVGRLFDAIAALTGVRNEINYEAQAAIELESIADLNETGFYPIEIDKFSRNSIDKVKENPDFTLSTNQLFHEVIRDLRNSLGIPSISAKFHNGLAIATLKVCLEAKKQFHINEAVLSGGVWQNMTLLSKTVELLDNAGFQVYIHRYTPTNDGGISLGQAVIANYCMNL
jgi:hydrogenase maturation protein HypF